MFSLKAHARRRAQVVAVGAFASAASIASVIHAETLTFDPGLTPATPSGGSGAFNNGTANFSNGTSDVAPTQDDDVHFNAPGGTVTVPNGTLANYTNIPSGGVRVKSITINATGYTFNPTAGLIILNSGGTSGLTPISVTSGDVTFNSKIINLNGGALTSHNINVATGSTLTMASFTNGSYGSYGSLRKVGGGTINMTGVFNNNWAFNELFVDEGAIKLTGSSNASSGGVVLATGTNLSGNAGLLVQGGRYNPFSNGELNTSVFTVNTGANLSPGANVGTFGSVGTFKLTGPWGNQFNLLGNFAAGSNLNLDIASASSYDKFQLAGDSYGMGTVRFDNGALVNINATAPLNPGTYNIISGTRAAYGTFLNVNNAGLTIGTAPAGFEYNIQDVLDPVTRTVSGINLVVSVPTSGSTWAPASTNWTTNANWSGGGAPTTAGTTATLNGAGGSSVNVDAASTVGRILLSGATNYNVSGAALTLDNTGGNGANALIRATAGSHTFNSSIVTGATDLDVAVAPAAALALTGGINNTAGKVVTLRNNGGTLTIGAVINEGTILGTGDATLGAVSGAGGITVSAGTLTLSAPGTYSGPTVLTGGSLSIDSLDKIGTSNINFRGGTLRVTGTTLTNIDGRITFPKIFNGGFDIADPNHTFTLGTTLGDYGVYLTKTGPGTLKLTTDNFLTVGAKVSQGTLLVNSPNGTGGGYSTIQMDGGTLGGTGVVSGHGVMAGANPHTIHPSATLAPGTTSNLTLIRLTTSANTTLKFNLTTPAGANDRITVSQANRFNIENGVKLDVGSTTAGSVGYFKVIEYAGTLNGNVNNISVPAMSTDYAYFASTTRDPGFITLHRGFLGDADDNGTVSFQDFISLANNFGLANTTWHQGDFNLDGSTTFTDYILLANHFGQSAAGGSGYVATAEELGIMQAFAASVAPVPEPASLTILGLSATLLLRRRKGR